jgi:hypothetical protein
MDLQYSKLDISSASREDIKAEIERLTTLMNIKKNEEQAIKIFINSCYGATASAYFVGFNIKVAEAITLQGQELIKFVQSIMNRYFLEFWHRDKELHQKLGLTRVARVMNDVSVYGDTDSVAADSIIRTEIGDLTIESIFNSGTHESAVTPYGHESVTIDYKILNWDETSNSLYYGLPTRVFRHKVKKPRYKLSTADGKIVYVTGDHSLIIWRNNEKMVITAKEVIPGDKVMVIS